MSNKRNEEAWDELSDHYQSSRRISTENYHYGAYSPGERELGILGDVTGLDILEIGCGGGQNAIVLAKWGAKSIIGIDQSEKQLKHATALAKQEGIDVMFLKCDMEDLSIFEDKSFDLVVSSHAMNYASDLNIVFSECIRILRSKGRIVTCLSHPLYNVLGEALEQNDFSLIVNYFIAERETWDWRGYNEESLATFESTPWQFGQIINGLISAGFVIEQIQEPKGYTKEEIRTLSPDAVPYIDIGHLSLAFIEIGNIIPSAIIVKARKFEK